MTALLALQQRFIDDLPSNVEVDIHIGLRIPCVMLTLPEGKTTSLLRLYVEPTVNADDSLSLDRVQYRYGSGGAWMFIDYDKLVDMILKHGEK